MNSFTNYILESAISLGVLSLVYFFFLRKETFFRLNRYFLLISVVFSATLPLLHLKVYPASPTMLDEVTVSQYRNLIEVVTIYGTGFSGKLERFITSYKSLGYIYVFGVLFFTFLLLFRITQVAELIQNNKVTKKHGVKLVTLDRDFSPFSFLNYVFISKNLHQYEDWEKMLSHEIEHIRQGHSWDVIIIGVLSIIQWFNPFFWLLRRALRENHEYSADHAVLAKGVSKARYKSALINQLIGDQLVIASSFNYSLIKSRIQMMSRIKSRKQAGIKFIIGILMGASLVIAFACEDKEKAGVNEKPVFQFINISEALLSDPSYTQKLNVAKGLLNSSLGMKVTIDSLKKDFDVKLEDGIIFINKKFNYRKAIYIVDGQLADISYVEGQQKNSFNAIEIIKDGEKIAPYIEKYGQQALEGIVLCYMNTFPPDSITSQGGMNMISEIITFSPNNAEEVFFIVEEMPEFPGGELALKKFIGNSIKYPVIAQENGIQGKVYVTFVVDKFGKTTKARVVRGVDPLLDKEALRVVSQLPIWKPGMQKGKAVNIAYTVPINFKLQ